jgi:hypothetical protein
MSGIVILVACIAGFVVAGGLTFVIERRAIEQRIASWSGLFAVAREGAVRDDRPPFAAPLSGRPALAVHIEVIVKERHNDGGVEQTTFQRVFETALGRFALDEGGGRQEEVDFSEARIHRLADSASIFGVTVFAPSTSMFGPAGYVPPHLHHFLVERGLPLPTVDSLFTPGRGLMINERCIVPGTRCWVATTDDGTRFDLGTTAEAASNYRKRFTTLWNAFSVGLIVGIVAGMLTALVPQFFKK